jgi:hypothetical protein
MSNYVKPVLLSKGHASEPVEAGCCIRSCGGSPRVTTSEISETASEKIRKVIRV